MLALLGVGGAGTALPAWARGGTLTGHIRPGFDELGGNTINLSISAGHRFVQGRAGHAIAVNGSIPGPLIRLKQGQMARLNVTNLLTEDSSIHWHGLLLPFQMDGVPGVAFPGIAPGKTFTYEFPVRQAGTYWWHSHSGLQEQSGHYGPIVIDPADPDPVHADRDYVLLLSEFTPHHPHRIMSRLKGDDGYYNYQRTTWTDPYPLAGKDRRSWARMRMNATDIQDVGGSEYTFLANGRGPKEGMEYLFRAGERIRLRIINGSGMTFFNIRIPGLPMTVVAADGQNVRPVEVDELQMGVAETYDVLVEPGALAAYTLVAESMDRTGMAVATLASAPGLRADVPALRAPVLLTMADMGMDHSMGMGTSNLTKAGAALPSMDMHGMPMRDTSVLPPEVAITPGIDMVAMMPKDRMGEPGLGLTDIGHRTLNYGKLAALTPNEDVRPPSRSLQIHLTGNMKRYMWSFDGRKFTAVSENPIRFAFNERVRVKLINDTMMAHPIHLHGHFFHLVNGQDAAHQPSKHTVIVQPGGSARFDLTANEPGDWAFHCHLLFHMHAGMFQIVSVARPEAAA
jgi:CopA family copper-resistance protein